jgi:hypothetical protein
MQYTLRVSLDCFWSLVFVSVLAMQISVIDLQISVT